ncbi:hypothetical protein [Lederbergia citri]|uniref:Uncharacterized protein n=1 Tax=Lederbergia citri TaxID=2833580 RepID=A0A942YHG3_9BACI|nr:hypothetical protein [Lederbergia citri]MBS4195395.1 hypothetical protein [Lederbergia citri]
MEQNEDFYTFSNGWTWEKITLTDDNKIKKILEDIPAADIWVNNLKISKPIIYAYCLRIMNLF